MESTGVRIKETHFERCAPAGQALLKQATEEFKKRARAGDSEIEQVSKDLAKHICGLARNKVSFVVDADDYNRIFGGKNVKKHIKRRT